MEFLLERFASAPGDAAFVSGDVTVTYGQLTEWIALERRWLREAGIAGGQVVAVVADYSPETYALLLALALEGSVVVPLSTQAVVERDTALDLAEAGFLIDASGPAERTVVRLASHTSAHPLLARLAAASTPGLVLFSSGSTGTPKGIVHDLGRVAEKFRRQGRPHVAICFLMIDHFGGLNTLLAITSSLGTVVTVPDRSPRAICEAIERQRVTLLPTTPSFLTMLLASRAHTHFDLSSLEVISYGTEVMPQTTLDRLESAFPNVRLLQTYGLSEVGVLRSQSRDDGSRWVRVGGAGFETRVVDGILWVRSAYAMLGYLGAPDPFDPDGWFCTQDRVEQEGEWLRILGRDTDLINVAGQKVYPAEIEDCILELDGIEDVAVHAEPHPLLGAIVVARVRTVGVEEAASLKLRVRKHCLARLAPYKVPTRVVRWEGATVSARQKKLRRAS